MFQEEYKKAYDGIKPRKLNAEELYSRMEAQRDWKVRHLVKPIAVSALSICLFCMLAMPVLAEQIPAVYRVIQKFAPALAAYVLPEETSCTSKDITLQVEAVNIDGNTGEIILSFSDADGSSKDQISGRVDLYDSYRIVNYGEAWQSGGCSFLEYDPVEDKAFFKVDITSEREFEKDKVRFAVTQLLTRYEREERKIGLEQRIEDPKEKILERTGGGGVLEERSKIPFYVMDSDSTSRTVRVMDVVELNEVMVDELRVTGVAYDEGVLRVQQCRGNFKEADRHIRIYLKDSDGNERIPDASASWQEEIDGERVLFDETWFLITEEELSQYDLYGMFYVTDGSVKGDWEVTFSIEN